MSTATIDLAEDELITLGQACRPLPKKPAPSTLWRWHTKGVKINGRTIKLVCVRAGGQWFTTATAFADFLRQQTEAALAPPDEAPAERTANQVRRLSAAGLI